MTIFDFDALALVAAIEVMLGCADEIERLRATLTAAKACADQAEAHVLAAEHLHGDDTGARRHSVPAL